MIWETKQRVGDGNCDLLALSSLVDYDEFAIKL